MSIREKNYDSYLAVYGHVYGDMKDPAKREAAIKALRRRDAKALAAARRELRDEIASYDIRLLRVQFRKYSLFATDAYFERYRYANMPHMRAVDVHWLRMIKNEFRQRNVSLPA